MWHTSLDQLCFYSYSDDQNWFWYTNGYLKLTILGNCMQRCSFQPWRARECDITFSVVIYHLPFYTDNIFLFWGFLFAAKCKTQKHLDFHFNSKLSSAHPSWDFLLSFVMRWLCLVFYAWSFSLCGSFSRQSTLAKTSKLHALLTLILMLMDPCVNPLFLFLGKKTHVFPSNGSVCVSANQRNFLLTQQCSSPVTETSPSCEGKWCPIQEMSVSTCSLWSVRWLKAKTQNSAMVPSTYIWHAENMTQTSAR